MKRLIFFIVWSLLCGATLFGQAGLGFRHQGVLRDNGNLVVSQNVGVQYMIRQGTPAGTMLYSETVNTTTDAYGLFSATVGAGNPAQFLGIDWSNGPFFLEVVVNGTNMGTTEITKAPLAYNADQTTSLDNHDLDALGNVTGTPSNGEVLKYNGTNWAPATEAGSKWEENGATEIYYDAGNVGVGTDNPATNFEVRSDFESSRLMRVRLDSARVAGQADMLEMYGPPTSMTDEFQFIEFQRGTIPVARVNGDGSAEFKSIEFEDGTVQTTAAPTTVAFGTISSGGTIYNSNSGNFTVTWNSGSSRYEITITGENYFFQNYTAMVTPVSSSIRSHYSSSVSGKLLVYLRDSSGSLSQGIFQFSVIKP
ncbi:MAG: hypothetical protein AAGI38_19680 [Bacteroidota bacterium]